MQGPMSASGLLLLLTMVGLVLAVERGFVYCPAHLCACESVDGALVINCRHLYLSSLPKFLSFDGRVVELSLRYNSIQHLPARGFQGLHVERLDLLDNAVSVVHQDAFAGLEHCLRSLSIQLYAVYGLPSRALSRLANLQTLIIVGCNQQQLLPGLFLNLTALKELHLTGCRTAYVQAGALTSLSHLQTLVLAQNALQSQHLAEISLLEDLLVLDLSSNNIRNLSRLLFPGFCKLRTLKAASNKLTYIAKETFANLDFSLEELDVRDNHIDERALGSLANLRLLVRLDVSDNNIHTLSRDYFAGLRYIQTLSLANNKVTTVGRHSFLGLGFSLQELNLRGNPLEFIEAGTFEEFRVLEKLNLSHTKLGQRLGQYTFHGLSLSLKYLDLSMSQLTSDDIQAIASLTNLVDLDVSCNHICSIDLNLLTTSSQLTRANFSYNNAFTFANLPASGSSLQTLDLSWNSIQTMQGCGLFVLRELRDVHLQGNPLACDCGLSWLYRWLQIQRASRHLAMYNWTCSSPASLRGSQFPDLQFADLKCPHSAHHGSLCPQLPVRPYTGEFSPVTRIIQLNSTPPCSPMCLNISRPDPSSVHVEWKVRNIKEKNVYNLSLHRHNGSVGVQAATLPASSENYTFVNVYSTVAMDVCIVALTRHLQPLVERCQLVPLYEDRALSGTDGLGSLIENSFLPLLFIYISGSLAVAFLVACVVVCIHRQRNRPRPVKPFYLTYPAWYDNRSSICSSSSVCDPHLMLSGNAHTRSTSLVDRLSFGCQDSEFSLPQGLPSRPSSRRESRLCPSNCRCSTVTSVFTHQGEGSVTGAAPVNTEFFFHF
ncbi:hypothetical protein BsWGS_10600 [Bradybaena similaris]